MLRWKVKIIKDIFIEDKQALCITIKNDIGDEHMDSYIISRDEIKYLFDVLKLLQRDSIDDDFFIFFLKDQWSLQKNI